MQGGAFFNGTNDYQFVMRGGTPYFYTSTGTPTNATLTNASSTNQVYSCQVADHLYLSTGNTSGGGEYIHAIANADTTTEILDTSAGVTGAKYLTANGYRIFAVVEPDTIYVSKILPAGSAPFFGTTPLNIRIGQDSAPITGLYSWQDFNVLVFKEDSIWVVNANPGPITPSATVDVSKFTVRQVSNRVGTVSHKSIAQVGNDAFFLARDGVRSVTRVINAGMASTTEPLSLPIQDLIDRINWSSANTACACYRDRKYLLSVPLDGATSPNTTLVFNTSTQGWSYWTGVSPAEWIYTDFGEPILSCADSNGFIAEYRDYVDLSNVVRGDYVDFLDGAGVDDAASGWTDNGGYVQFDPDIDLVVGDIILITELLDSAGADVAGAKGTFVNVTEVDGDDVTVSFEHNATGGGPSSSVSFIKGVKEPWKIVSRAMMFGEQLNPKVLDWVELEFAKDSDAYCDLKVLLDDTDPITADGNLSSGGGTYVSLPVVLPFVIPQGKLTRNRIGLYGGDSLVPSREIQFQLEEDDNLSGGQLMSSKVVALRSITAAGFIEEFEVVE